MRGAVFCIVVADHVGVVVDGICVAATVVHKVQAAILLQHAIACCVADILCVEGCAGGVELLGACGKVRARVARATFADLQTARQHVSHSARIIPHRRVEERSHFEISKCTVSTTLESVM